MPHVTFIHGIANKPDEDTLVRIWRDSLAANGGLDLGAEGVTSSMVYWADVLYPEPKARMAAHESNDSVVERSDPDVDPYWLGSLEGPEQEWVQKLADRYGVDAEAPEGDEDFVSDAEEIGVEFERIPLPWWLKRRLMKILLRDVHHYLFNTEFSPRPGETYAVQDEIRSRFVESLQAANEADGPHIVVSHSMGTVIAYDCLKRVPGCPAIDGLMTVGSPLGLDEIQDLLQPGWTEADGFPQERVDGDWINVYDALDPVAGLDPNLADDYKRGGNLVVEDIHEPNSGTWRHNLSKYMHGSQLRNRLTTLLGL